MSCERCIGILQVCYKSQSVDDAKEGLKQFGCDGDLDDEQATA